MDGRGSLERVAVVTAVKLTIPSEIRLVDFVHAAAEKLAEIAGFTSEDGLDLGLAVRETVINAIRHGNAEDPDTRVHVVLSVEEDGVRASVRDEGNGFDPSSSPDPTSPDNRLRTSGRGLLLIRAFVDDVRFSYRKDRGLTVTLYKRLRREPRREAGQG